MASQGRNPQCPLVRIALGCGAGAGRFQTGPWSKQQAQAGEIAAGHARMQPRNHAYAHARVRHW